MSPMLLLIPILLPVGGGLAWLIRPVRDRRRGRVVLMALTLTTSVMTALVFVTWNRCPLWFVNEPPFIVKCDWPLSASPENDW